MCVVRAARLHPPQSGGLAGRILRRVGLTSHRAPPHHPPRDSGPAHAGPSCLGMVRKGGIACPHQRVALGRPAHYLDDGALSRYSDVNEQAGEERTESRHAPSPLYWRPGGVLHSIPPAFVVLHRSVYL